MSEETTKEKFRVDLEIVKDLLFAGQNLSLYTALTTLQRIDEGLVEADLETMKKLGEFLPKKLDACQYKITELEGKADKISVIIDQLDEIRSRFARDAERIHNQVFQIMKATGFDKMPGILYKAEIKKSEAVEILKDPDANLSYKYPNLVRTKYEWEKVPLRKAIEAGDEDLAKVARVRFNEKLKISVNKDVRIEDLPNSEPVKILLGDGKKEEECETLDQIF